MVPLNYMLSPNIFTVAIPAPSATYRPMHYMVSLLFHSVALRSIQPSQNYIIDL